MTAKHTPGPWVLNSGVSSNVVLIDSNPTNGAVGEIVDCRNRADALLIAAAPDLLEALKNADKLISQLMPGIKHIALQDYAFLNNTLMANTDAISKATGVQA
jgi:hypothetical protein